MEKSKVMSTSDHEADLAREEYMENLEKALKAHRVLARRCAQCGGEPAYVGAIYCGAGCTARSEAHEPLAFKDMEMKEGQ